MPDPAGTADIHPPGRRRLRSAVRPDGYQTRTIELARYEALRVGRSSPQRVRTARG